MKRPMLISGITIAISCIFLILFSKIAYVVVPVLAVSVFILYFIKPLKLKKFVFLPLICVCALLAALSFVLNNHLLINPVLKYDNTVQTVTGKIITTPQHNNGFVTFTIKTLTIDKSTENIRIAVSLSEEHAEGLKLYDVISVTDSSIFVPRNNSNRYDVSNYSDGVILQGTGGNASLLWKAQRTPYYYCLKFKEDISKQINNYTTENTAGILTGMIFGNSKSIDSDTINGFRNSGIAHLLAVSGLHTSLWCSLLILILKLFNVPEKLRNSFCIVFLCAFCVVSAFTPSVMRASFMMLIILLAPFFKRRGDSLNSLGLAVAVLLLINPYTIASVSFQLSVTATFGVIAASEYERKIHSKTNAIKHKIPRRITDYICTSLLVSVFAGIFTLPVSAYYFNVFSILSPVANLLCVIPAFFGMVSGLISVALSFFNNSFIADITILFFDFTHRILTFISKISSSIGSLEYCTLPVHKEILINSIIMVSLLLFMGYIIKAVTKSSKPITITAIFSVICIFINIGIPLFPTKYQNTLTVVSSGNNTNIVLRSGTHYMYIANNEDEIPSGIYDHLPKATSEALDYYIVTYTSYNNLTDIEKINRLASPTETYIAPSIKYLCDGRKITLPKNTLIGYTGEYTLNDKINVEIVDTYRIKYVIIKGTENTVYIHLHGNADFSDVVDTSEGDIFIYCGKTPANIPKNAKSVIINSNTGIIADKSYSRLNQSGIDIRATATHGDIKVII
ncbi:MAG: ComEC/Rec2 family competence protein [Clostridia bacterium]|nr:ComEC/Rec2 family competence protein [Clostridia bacterium]